MNTSHEPKPYTRPGPFYCGTCGSAMQVVGFRDVHNQPHVWVCVPCERAWHVPPQEATDVLALPWSVVRHYLDAREAAVAGRMSLP